MIGRTNSSFGKGDLSPDNAVIHVTAPAGSTITFSKGEVIVKTLGPEKSHVNANNNTFADWYYTVNSSNYGSWTVTASRSGYTTSKTITVSAANQYDVSLRYDIEIIKQGVRDESIAQALHNMNATALEIGTVNGRMRYQQTIKQDPLYVSFGPVDLTLYSRVSVTMSMSGASSQNTNKEWLGLGTSVGAYNVGRVNIRNMAKGTKTIDTSALTGNYYISIETEWSSNTPTFYVYDLIVYV